MSKKITTEDTKMKLVERLVKEGAIDFTEAILLLEVEVETQVVSNPFTAIPRPGPFGQKRNPWDMDKIFYGDVLTPKDPISEKFKITCSQ